MKKDQEKHISIRCPDELWIKFRQKAIEQGSSASVELRRFMQQYSQVEEVAILDEVEAQESPLDLPETIEWQVGDYFEDADGRRGWIKSLDLASGLAHCIVYGDTIRSVGVPMTELVEKIAV